jgi:hypothetical protein
LPRFLKALLHLQKVIAFSIINSTVLKTSKDYVYLQEFVPIYENILVLQLRVIVE